MLEAMVGAARSDVDRRRTEISQRELEEKLRSRGDSRPFHEALTRPQLSLIAEYKRYSPSASRAGEAAATAAVADQVLAYQRGGASALSILTDVQHFNGRLEDLREARSISDLPILRKDFTVDRYQLYEAAVFGADAVLLIVAVLDDRTLADLYDEAQQLDLDCILEVRDQEQLEKALEIDADIIGINNRDLGSLEVDVATTYELMPDVPAGKTVVAESGISSRAELEELERVGVDAVLIGSALMSAADPEAKTRELTGAEEGTREHHLP
ncbi:MAG TPA: indole-3-glycerol phosphate synthase TrpC [Solirubrobacterales bacterium]